MIAMVTILAVFGAIIAFMVVILVALSRTSSAGPQGKTACPCPTCGEPLDERFHNPVTGRCLGDYN